MVTGLLAHSFPPLIGQAYRPRVLFQRLELATIAAP